MARWIKYQIVCNADKNILLNKKLEYSDANLIIAQNEAHEGAYTIEEDEKNIEKEPLGIELGGTHAKSAEGARANLDVYSKKEVESYAAKSGHTHGKITNDGKIGTSSNQFLTTTTGGAITTSTSKRVMELLGLPAVEATDNGKFMRVVNGVWAAVTVTDASGVSF